MKYKLKPFDLEKAKAGHAVCTKHGRHARIICFDKKGEKPLVALISNSGSSITMEESSFYYFSNGALGKSINPLDLFMEIEKKKKKKVKKEGWINIYEGDPSSTMPRCVYSTKKKASSINHKNNHKNNSYIETIKIKWKEKKDKIKAL